MRTTLIALFTGGLLGAFALWAARPAPVDDAYPEIEALAARIDALEAEVEACAVRAVAVEARGADSMQSELRIRIEDPRAPASGAAVTDPVADRVPKSNQPAAAQATAAPAARAEPVEPAEDPWQPPARDSKVFDIDGSGRVTKDERERADELAVRASEFAAQRSSDGSYPILADDFRGHPKLFAAIDADGDGAMTAREMMRYYVESIRELRRYDQDHDGALALAEYGHLESRFGYLDTNEDARIEAWEINILRAHGRW